MAEPLRPDGDVFVEDVVIRTPGLTGMVEVYRPDQPRHARRGADHRGVPRRRSDDAGLAEQLSVVDLPAPGDHARPTARAAAAAPTTSRSTCRHRATATARSCCTPPRTARCRGTSPTTYRRRPRPTAAESGARTAIPKAVVPSDEQDADAHRGIVGAIGKKVLKVLVFPLVDPVLGKVGDHFAAQVGGEEPAQPGALDDGRRLPHRRWPTPFTDADWATLREGRALLLVHGTFSTRPRRVRAASRRRRWPRCTRRTADASPPSTTTASP